MRRRRPWKVCDGWESMFTPRSRWPLYWSRRLGEVSTQRIAGHPGEAVVEWLAAVAQPFRAVYEAGPTGYGLARRARERGLDVVVCAPGHILKNATDHIKVDKRDAVRLARLLSAGELRMVRVPEPDEEQLRDLVRSREDLRVDLTRIRNRIGKFLLRREIYSPQHTEAWGVLHRKWLRGLNFDDRASELVFEDALHAHDILVARRELLERALLDCRDVGVGAHNREAEMLARNRHPISARPCGGGGGLPSFSTPAVSGQLPGSGAERALLRREAAPRWNHQGRL